MNKDMRGTGFYIGLACVMGLLQACNELDVVQPTTDNEIPAVVVTPTLTKQLMINLSLVNNFGSRWMENDQVSLFLMKEGQIQPDHEENSNVKATYRSGAWVIDDDVLLTDESWKAYAYYPYTPNLVYDRIPIAATDTIDHRIGKTELSFGFHNYSFTVEMMRPKSKVNVYVRRQGRVEEKTVRMARPYKEDGGLPISGLLDIRNQHIEYTLYGELKKTGLNYVVGDKKDCDPIEFMVLPTVQKTKASENIIASRPAIELEMDGQSYTAQLPETVSAWEAGKLYTVNMLFNGETVEIESVSIAVWKTIEFELN